MPAPSLFTLTVCSAAVALAFYSGGKDQIDAARDTLADEYRHDVVEFRWTINALPGEVRSAGEEMMGLWRRVSTSVAVEAEHLKERYEAERAAEKNSPR